MRNQNPSPDFSDQQVKAHIKALIQQDAWRMQCLQVAASLHLPQWSLAAGFVRNLVWDYLHGFSQTTPLTDIDLIYFDPSDTQETTEKKFEQDLKHMFDAPWSVKNQARMHIKNSDKPYSSSLDAMAYWVEEETAVGAFLHHDAIEIMSPFKLNLHKKITLNQKRPKLDAFYSRIAQKSWLEIWPELKVCIGTINNRELS